MMDEYDYRQQIMNSNTLLKPMIKSQYRGVYRCGKKWKVDIFARSNIICIIKITCDDLSTLGSNAK